MREALDTAIVDYLRAEQDLGRLPQEADIKAITLTLVATVHDLLLHGRHPEMGDDGEAVARVIRTLVDR